MADPTDSTARIQRPTGAADVARESWRFVAGSPVASEAASAETTARFLRQLRDGTATR